MKRSSRKSRNLFAPCPEAWLINTRHSCPVGSFKGRECDGSSLLWDDIASFLRNGTPRPSDVCGGGLLQVGGSNGRQASANPSGRCAALS
jgi:hypothetical protein